MANSLAGFEMINIKSISTALLIFIGVLAISAGSASYGHISSHGKMIKDVKAHNDNNYCQAYLRSAHQTVQNKETGVRGKSHIAAVGILFGARYAVGSASVDEQANNQRVMAIKNFRNCLKERALKS